MIEKKRFVWLCTILFFVSIIVVYAVPSSHDALGLILTNTCSKTGTKEIFTTLENGNWEPDDYGACDGDDFTTTTGNEGCDVLIVNYDSDPDDCAQYRINNMFVLRSNKDQYVTLSTTSKDYSDEGNDEGAQCFTDVKWRSNSATSYICSYDQSNSRHKWYDCNTNSVKEILKIPKTPGSKEFGMYICLARNTGGYIWKDITDLSDETIDQDSDGVPDDFDCAKDNDQIYPSFPKDCVQPDKEGKVGKDKVVCIVKAADEVAGNDIDENCDGKKTTDADEDKDSCTDGKLNSGGVAYFWMPDALKSQQCCGDDSDDFGKIFSTDAGERVCLNKDPKKVGVVGGVEQVVGKTSCNGDWCAPLASSDNVDFHIFTLKQSGKEAYDVVSNGEKWQACAQSAPVTLATPIGEKATVAHGFSCYQEGDHWSWVYCKAKASNEQVQDSVDNGIKNRVEGDGLFALPLLTGKDAKSEGKSSIVIDISKSYSTFYNDKSFDLIKPDGKEQYLEAYIRFTPQKITYPATVNLKIRGPKVEKETIIYFDQSILGYATNTPLLEPNRWIHVKIPLPTLYDVTSLEFKSSPEENTIEIRNVYLTYGDKPKICSGEASTEQSAWLDDLDWFEEGKKVTGEKLCNVLFDPKYVADEKYKGTAWLGNEGRCCGNNDKPEYYAGKSTPINEKDYYGCWNSEPVKANSRVMDVEVGVEYTVESKDITYPAQAVGVSVKLTESAQWSYCASQLKKYYKGESLYAECTQKDDAKINKEKTEFMLDLPRPITNLDIYWDVSGTKGCSESEVKASASFFLKDQKISSTPYIFVKVLECNDDCTVCHGDLSTENNAFADKIVLNTEKAGQKINIYGLFARSNEGKTIFQDNRQISAADGNVLLQTIEPSLKIEASSTNNKVSISAFKEVSGTQIFATTREAVIGDAKKQSLTQSFTFSCTPLSDSQSPEKSSECTYPLPGEPPFTITNPHPDLYELYFVEKDEKGVLKETLITSAKSTFNAQGNIRVKKLAQQVIYTSDGTSADFYGCNAAGYLIGESKVTAENNKWYCTTAGSKYFCAPSVEKTIGVDKYTVIDSWSDQKLDRVGYDLTKDKTFDLKTYVPQLRQIHDTPIEAVERNHSSQVLATRNFIPNAEFITKNNKIPGWDLFKENVVVQVEFLSGKDKVMTLKDNEILRSERIAIPPNSNLQFSAETGTCTPKILLKGTQEVSSSSIDTGDARYLILEFRGPCTIHKPFLQLVDDKGAVKEYNYVNPTEISRAGIGCCPDNSCWNGYACVEDMTPFSQFAEHISDGRDYRCIEGTWTSSPVKYSWNGDQWGFCPKDNQCFVRPSDPTNALVQSKFTIKDIYTKDKNFPLCINDKESILDHYCDNGDWTSRTKFIASKLIDIAGDDHYTLYCAPPQQVFLEYDNKQQYIFGETPVKEEPKPKEFNQAKDTKPIQPSCFGFTPEISKSLGLTGLDKEDRCINNVCVLKFQDSGTTKTAFATTLNKAATDPTSFMKALNLEPADVPTRCKATDAEKDKFVKCSLEGLDTKGELWYSPSFNAIMYSKDGITTSTSITDTILKFFKDLFSKTTTPEGKLPLKLLTDAKNVKDIYLLHQGEKQVTAITEIRGSNTTLIAEYKGFTTPICQYMTNFISNDPNLKEQALHKFTGQDKVRCYITDDNTQRVEATEGIDIFWPKLTGMLRVEEQE